MTVTSLCLDTSVSLCLKLIIINMYLCLAMAYTGALMVTKSGGCCTTVGQMGLFNFGW